MQAAYLSAGMKIGITCPSGYVAHSRIEQALHLLHAQGYATVVGKTIGLGAHYFAGTDEERLADLQAMMDDPSIHAIWMGRGGYGMSRIIDQIDFSKFLKHPKWICGFSDITVLHSHIQAHFGIPTMHSLMCGSVAADNWEKEPVQSFLNALQGKPLHYEMPAHAMNVLGQTEATLVGGNLAILAHLTGSSSQIDTKDKILFIEDIGEHVYQIDRMLYTLQRSGQLSQLKGLLVGSFTDIEDTERPFGQSVQEVIWDKVAGYGYPVCFNMPCGHQYDNRALRLGMPYELIVTEEKAVLSSI